MLAVVATAGLVAIGTVVAQQPPPTGYNPPRPQPGTISQYDKWTPPPGGAKQPQGGVQPVGGLALPPGYTPVGSAGRPTQPVMAGPDGVRPAGGFDIPPPRMDLPTARPGAGAPPPPPASFAPPALPPVPTDSKFGPSTPLPPAGGAPAPFPDTKPGTPPVPPAGVTPLPPPSLPATLAGPATPSTPTAPPVPPAGVTPVPPPSLPATPSAPSITPVPTAPAAGVPTTPTGPAVAPTTPTATTPSPAVLPARAAPSVVVEAVCPESVVFGQEFAYKLIVRNTGTTPVSYVRVDDELPAGSRYVSSDQQVELNGDRLSWMVGTMEAGTEKQVTIRVKPGEEGEIRSRATVSFAASVDAKTRVTRPRLAVTVTGAEVSRAGEESIFQIKVVNAGSGPATKLILQARLSDGLLHSQGMVIEAELPSLPAGETKSIPLKVNAAKAGLQWCQVVVTADGSPDATAKASVNVVEPMLVVKQSGPAKVLVRGTDPTFTIELANPGTAATDPVQVHSVLPDGFEFATASDGGAQNGRTVTWKLPSLSAGSTRSVTLKLHAATASDGVLRTIAQAGPMPVQPAAGTAPGALAPRPAGRGLEAKVETAVVAEGVAAVRFEVAAIENPVEVGKEAVYEIRVTNQGTGPCTNVQLAAALSEGTEFVGVGPNPPTAVKSQGLGLIFDAIPSVGVKGEAVYRVRVKGLVAGDLRFRVQLSCDQLKTPVIKEESTRFYKE